MNKVYILFGEMGGGKNYHGEILADQFDADFLDGDLLLPDNIKKLVSEFKPLSKEMIEDYVLNHLGPAIVKRSSDDKLFVAQALYLNHHRMLLGDYLMKNNCEVFFYWVHPTFFQNLKNLFNRPKSFKWILYWLLNKPFFEPPAHSYREIK